MRMLLNSAKSDQIALRFDKEEITYKELEIYISKWSSLFLKIKQKEMILVFLDSGIHFVSVFFAILKTKGIFFPVDTSLSATDLRHLIKRFKVRYVITEERYKTLFDEFEGIELTGTEQIKCLERLDVFSFKRKNESKMICQFTSGSTGDSKPVFRTLSDLIEESENVAKRLKLSSDDVLFCPLKLPHSFALTTCLTSILNAGGRFVGMKYFLPSAINKALSKKVTIIAASPYIYELLCKLKIPIQLFNQIRLCITAGAPLTKEVHDRFNSIYDLSISNLYGMTETGAVSVNYPLDKNEIISAGKPFRHIQILLTKGERISIKKKIKVIKTRDKGIISEKGNLFISGRIDSQMIINGKKINPEKIIKTIQKHKAVSKVSVFKKILKNRECIIARYESSCNISKKEIFELCLKNLPGFMIPNVFIKTTLVVEKRLV